jgi:hypothetical protein
MKPDDLEQRLARTPRSGPPPAWREEILAAARAARRESPGEAADLRAGTADRGRLLDPAGETVSVWVGILGWGRRLFAGGSPWAVLAAGWVLVLGLHQAGTWVEWRGASAVAATSVPTPAAVDAAFALTAARMHRAEVLALANRDDLASEPKSEAEAGTGSSVTPGRSSGGPTGRPRKESAPGRQGAAGRPLVRWV